MVESALERLVPLYADDSGLIPEDRVAGLRSVLVEVMDAVCGELADLSAARTAEFYTQVREMSVGQSGDAMALHRRDPDATEGAVRALVQSVVETGLADRLATALGDRVDYEVKRASGECIEENGRRDRADVRYARVPTGGKTCPFCNMLASRGFVYHSAKTAGADGHYHANCRCRIVPGFDTYYAGASRRLSASTTVEGYDPDALYDQYVEDLHSGKLKLKDVNGSTSHVLHWKSERFASYSDFARFVGEAKDMEDLQLRCAVAEQEWPKTGLSGKYYSRLRMAVSRKRAEIEAADPGVNPGPVYEKPRSALEEHEKAGVDHLFANGIRPVVKLEDPEADANFDLEMDGVLWEMKNVSNSRGSVANQLSRARKKFYRHPELPKRVVFTCEGCSDEFSEVCSSLERRRRDGEVFLAVSEDGEIARIG